MQKTKPKIKRVTQPGRMNSLEASFAEHLKTSGIPHVFESVKLRLANRTWYTPDFLAVDDREELVFYEVKGFWRDDARVKLKVAAEQYPWFGFVAAQKQPKRDGGGWVLEYF